MPPKETELELLAQRVNLLEKQLSVHTRQAPTYGGIALVFSLVIIAGMVAVLGVAQYVPAITSRLGLNEPDRTPKTSIALNPDGSRKVDPNMVLDRVFKIMERAVELDAQQPKPHPDYPVSSQPGYAPGAMGGGSAGNPGVVVIQPAPAQQEPMGVYRAGPNP